MKPLILALALPALAGPNTALVGYTSPAALPGLKREIGALGGTVRYCTQTSRICAADFPDAPPLEPLAALQGARYALPDAIMPARQSESFPDADGTDDCTDLWDLEILRADTVWGMVYGASANPVAIEDSGFLLTHEELEGTKAFAWDYGDGDSNPEVVYGVSVPGHGTFIAGLVAAVGDNGVGRAGLAPGVQIAYQKIADRGSALYYSYAIEAMGEVADDGAGGARVLSYSLASSSSYGPFEEAVAALGDADKLLVAAAANCGSGAWCWDGDNDEYPQYPASYDGDFILSVASSLDDDTLNPYSHYGRESVDIAAPGYEVCSLGIDSGSDYETESGTSYATPLVAAAANLLWELYPSLTAPEVAYLIKATAEPSADLADRVSSGGRLDLLDALRAPLPELSVFNAAVALEPTGTLTLDLGTRAAAASEVTVLLLHDDSVTVTDAGDWTVTRLDPELAAEAGYGTLTQTATLITGSLSAEDAETLDLTVEASANGETSATVRVRMEGSSGVLLGAPLDEDDDETGEPAYALIFQASGVEEPVETGTPAETGETDTPDDETGSPETGESGEADSAAPEGDSSPTKGGCACSTARGVTGGVSHGAWLGALALALGLRRRRPRTASDMVAPCYS